MDPGEPARDHARFLAELHDRLRDEGDAKVVLTETIDRLAAHLGVSRTGYGEFNDEASFFHPRAHWTDGSVVSIDEPIPFDAFGPVIVASHRAGELWIHESLDDPNLDEQGRETCRALGIVSVLTVPVLKGGRLRSLISVQQSRPRRWTDGEIALVRELADRTWATLERVRAEEARAESDALLSAILLHAPIGIHLKDVAGRYRLVNDAMARMVGRPREAMLGRSDAELFDADTAAAIDARDRAALGGGVPTTDEEPGPPGTRFDHGLTMRFPVETRRGTELAGFTIDVSERKRADAELARSRDALYQSEKMTALGSLLAGVSHELNNPLAIIVAQAELLARDAAGTPAADRAARICRAAERSARIVHTFLAMARQRSPQRRTIRIEDVVAAALDLTAYALRTSGVTVTVDHAHDLPAIIGDADQLHQVVLNMVVNAQQAMEQSEADRSLTLTTRHDPESRTVALDIADTGPGVPETLRRRIFEPFFTTKPEGAGTGVGLSFSQGIVEAHGGRLDLVETRPTGSTFRVTLPTGTTEASAVDSRSERGRERDSSRRRALVVDDEPDVADSLAEILDMLGYDTVALYDADAAQAAIEGTAFDLIVSDYRMPGRDGMALFEWLGQEHPGIVTAFAFSTGDTLGAAARAFIERSGRPMLEKPFTVAAVRDLLGQVGR